MYFSEDILFSLPSVYTVRSTAITFQGFGGNFNYCGMLLCIHPFVSAYVLLCATRNSCSVFGRETLSTCSLTLGLIVTLGCFQVVLKEFGRVSSSWGYWNVFSPSGKRTFSLFLILFGGGGLYRFKTSLVLSH